MWANKNKLGEKLSLLLFSFPGEFASYELRPRKRDTTREKKNQHSSWWFTGWHDRMKSYGTLRNPMKSHENRFLLEDLLRVGQHKRIWNEEEKMGQRANNVFYSARVIRSQSHTTVSGVYHFQCRISDLPWEKQLLSTKSKGGRRG